MKTRTNQTISMLVVASMVALTTAQINTLSAGDIVLKKDESGYHSYIVSYKKDGTGICLTYTDASCVETVSYDLVEGEWVYNSTDITPLGNSGTKLYVHEINIEFSEDYSGSIISPLHIISKSPTPLTDDKIAEMGLVDGTLINGSDDNYACSILYVGVAIEPDTTTLLDVICSDSSFNLESETILSLTDVVSEL